MFFSSFLSWTGQRTASADKMMVKAKGPVWHKKQKEQGIIPKRLRGVDKEATWSKSRADGWVYGHGTFSMVSHGIPVLGCFVWMPNSAHEGKKLWRETERYEGVLKTVVMDSKADDSGMFQDLKLQRGMDLVTRCRRHMNKSPKRRAMIRAMRTRRNRRLLKERGHTVEPMQGVAKDIFDLETCWMRTNDSNRWLFAAMGTAVQIEQLQAWKEGRSTWKIKREVLGNG